MAEAAQREERTGISGGNPMIDFEFLVMNFEMPVCATRAPFQKQDAREASPSIHNSKFTI
jgi:rubredoxin